MRGITLEYLAFGVVIFLVIVSLVLWVMGKRKKGDL